MKNKNNKGFTLIELLVVVLIIGILAAVALPQYQKAVEIARLAEAITIMNSLQKSIDIYILEHNFSEGELFFPPREPSIDLDIDLPSTLEHDEDNEGTYKSKYFSYYLYCVDGSCTIYATRTNFQTGDDIYQIGFTYGHSSRKWNKECEPYDDIGTAICKSLNY